MRTDVSIFHLRSFLFRVSAENQLFNEPLLLERLEGFHTSLLRITYERCYVIAFVAEYKSEVLDKLDLAKIYTELSDSILMCWEIPGENCHRRLVAEWIEKSLNVKIPEV